VRRPQISLEDLPAQSTQGVASVNHDHAESQQENIGVTHRVEKFCAAKIAEMKEAARAVRNKRQDSEANSPD
jgi:hypothetical protein